jgi:hypothetical protein
MKRSLNPDQRLVDVEKAPLGQRVPAPLHDRIEKLCDLAYEGGEPRRPSKMEMIAALLLASPTDTSALRNLLREYGEATVATALPWSSATDPGAVIELRKRTSGPRSGRSK